MDSSRRATQEGTQLIRIYIYRQFQDPTSPDMNLFGLLESDRLKTVGEKTIRKAPAVQWNCLTITPFLPCQIYNLKSKKMQDVYNSG